MLTVMKNGEIQLTRGDTAKLTVDLEDDAKQPYSVQPDDVVTLTVKRNYGDAEAVIEKKVKGTNVFHIKPEDTKGLAFGKYKYDVQLTTAEGDNYTVLAKKTFVIEEEVG